MSVLRWGYQSFRGQMGRGRGYLGSRVEGRYLRTWKQNPRGPITLPVYDGAAGRGAGWPLKSGMSVFGSSDVNGVSTTDLF